MPRLLTKLSEAAQWTCLIGESRRVEDLNAGIMYAVEWCRRSRAASVPGVRRRIEPKPKVINLNGVNLHPRG